MKIRLNGNDQEFDGAPTVSALVAEELPSSRWAAVVLDGAVVPRGNWESTVICDGSILEILTPRQGG